MRIALLVSMFYLLGLGVPQAPKTPDPADLVTKAVSLVVPCSYDVSAAEEAKGGKSKAANLSKGENEMKSKISLPILLRSGRYVYSTPAIGTYAGRPVWTIHFEPAPSIQPVVQTGEDERINRAMNNMSGDLQLERATGALIHLDAALKSAMLFSGTMRTLGIPIPVTVTVLSGTLHIDQKLVNGVWVPERAVLETWVIASWLIIVVPAHYTYTAPFHCGK
ncbi:MAG: hypothetical protein V4486_02705 [Patescibacteria group bacterium]